MTDDKTSPIQHDIIVKKRKEANLTPPSSAEAEVCRPSGLCSAKRILPLIEIEEEQERRSGGREKEKQWKRSSSRVDEEEAQESR